MPTTPHAPEHTDRPVRVALSNDYELVLVGLAAMLARHPDRVQVVDLTTEVRMAHEPDIVLFDTFGRLPRDDVKLEQVVAENDAKVVVFSWDGYPEDAARRAGAAGWLHKGLSSEDLVAALVEIHHGRPVPEGRGGGVWTHHWPGQTQGLTEREAEVLTYIVRGMSNQGIAERSFVSINTIKSQIRSAYAKIGVRTRTEAVGWGYRNGIDSTDDSPP